RKATNGPVSAITHRVAAKVAHVLRVCREIRHARVDDPAKLLHRLIRGDSRPFGPSILALTDPAPKQLDCDLPHRPALEGALRLAPPVKLVWNVDRRLHASRVAGLLYFRQR